jgi:hypothetical protein
MYQKRYYNIIIALLPLFFGGLIYICYRNENIVLFSWMQYFNINYTLLRLLYTENNLFVKFIIFSLPNGLWVLSGLLLLQVLIKDEKKLLSLYSIIFIIISIIIEISQLYSFLPGTFDINDLIAIILFSGVGLCVSKLRGET